MKNLTKENEQEKLNEIIANIKLMKTAITDNETLQSKYMDSFAEKIDEFVSTQEAIYENLKDGIEELIFTQKTVNENLEDIQIKISELVDIQRSFQKRQEEKYIATKLEKKEKEKQK